MEWRVQGFGGLRIEASRVESSGLRVQDLGFKGVGFRV